MKRKGADVASPPCSVVKSLPASMEPSSSLNSSVVNVSYAGAPTLSNSKWGPTEKPTWEKTRDALHAFLYEHDSTIQDSVRLVSECLLIASKIEQEAKEKPLKDFEALQLKISSRIQQEEELYQTESADLVKKEKELRQLEEGIKSLRIHQQSLVKEKSSHLKKIEEYKSECAEEIEECDEIEAQMMQQIPRVKKRISLYAQATGIKWNYDNVDMVEGEIVSSLDVVCIALTI